MLSIQSNSDAFNGMRDETDPAAAPRGMGFPLWVLPLIASWGYGLWLYGRLPAQVPVHWGFNGQVDRYGGPLEAAFLLPAMLVVIAVLMLAVLARFIPSTPEYAGTRRIYQQLVLFVLCFMLYIQVVTSWVFRDHQVHLLGLVTLGAGVLFILIGNLLPKLRRNPIAGIRLSWAMHDDVAWVRAQRAGGLSFVLLGLVLVCASPLPGYLPIAAMLAGKVIAVIAVVWYSWNVSRSQ